MRLHALLLSLCLVSGAACTKSTDNRSTPAPALNPDAANSNTTGGGGGNGDATPTPTPTATATPEPRYYAYAGGSGNQIGVYRFELPAGTFTLVKTVSLPGAVPSFLAFHPTKPWVYAVNESGTGGVMAFSLNPTNGELTKLNEIPASGQGPTHVSVDLSGKYVMTANYGTGDVNSFLIQSDGRLGATLSSTNAGLNAHQILSAPSGTAVYVPCLNSQHIAQYNLNASGQLVAQTPATLSVSSGGPRHMAFHPGSPWAYLVKEVNSTIQALSIDANGQLKLLGTALSTRPGTAAGNTGAEVQVHPSGSYVYSSNRGDNTIARFSINADGTLTYKDVTPTAGSTPRHFSILPNGKWLLIANQDSGTLTTLKVDPTTGALTASQNQPMPFTGAQFVEAIDLNRYANAALK